MLFFRWCSSRSRLVLSCLSLRFRVSPFFPLASSLHPHHLSFHSKRTAQASLIPIHPSIPSCIDPSIPLLVYPYNLSRPPLWKLIRPPSPIHADLVMLATLLLLLTSPLIHNPIVTNNPNSNHPTIMAMSNLTSRLPPLTRRLFRSLLYLP